VRPASRKDRREGFITRLFLEEVFEGLARIGVARRSGGRRRARSVRLSIRRWRSIFFNGHAEFVKGTGVLCVLRRDAFLDRLGAFELRAGIEKAALFAAVQFGLALGALPVGIESRCEHSTAIGTARAGDRADHTGRAGAELIGAARSAGGGLTFVLVLLVLLFRVAVTAVTILSIHKRLRPPSLDGLPQLQLMLLRCRACQPGLYPIGLLHSAGRRTHSLEIPCRIANV